ncbi:MAG: hypothetical protein ACI3Y5_06725 [Prevotella sp.]
MKKKKQYIKPDIEVIKMERPTFLAASPVDWDTEGKDTPESNGDEGDADEGGSLSKKHYKEYDLWGM